MKKRESGRVPLPEHRRLVVEVPDKGPVVFRLPNKHRQLELLELVGEPVRREAGRLKFAGAGHSMGLILGVCWYHEGWDLETPQELLRTDPRAYGEAVLDELEDGPDPWDGLAHVGPAVEPLARRFAQALNGGDRVEKQVDFGSRPGASKTSGGSRSASSGSGAGPARSTTSKKRNKSGSRRSGK